MKYCNKCGKKLKDSDILCTACGTKAEVTVDDSRLSKQTDSENEFTDTANIPDRSHKNRFLNILMIIGIIILSLLIIFIIAFIWQGFIDASNI